MKRRFRLMNVTGRTGEDIACEFLKRNGFRIVERNYRNPIGRALGEIDIVAKEHGHIVFVEVKTRSVDSCFDTLPESAITAEKLRRLARIAEMYLMEHGIRESPYRFDAVSVTIGGDRPPEIRHLRGIFL